MKEASVIRNELKNILRTKRYHHSLGVEEVAVKLGKEHGQDIENLRVAALLHDLGKSVERTDQVRYAEEHGIALTESDLKATGVIHGLISVQMAERDFGVNDTAILQAIRYHTTGFSGMTLFDKVIFAADYLDPNRGFRNERQLTELTTRDIEQGVFEIIKDKMAFVIKKGDALHPLSTEFYESQRVLIQKRSDK